MVEVKYLGRLGNKLFTYAVGRVIAEAMNYRLVVDPIKGFEGTNETVDGEVHEEPTQFIRTYQEPSLESVISNKNPRKIWLRAWMQKYEYIQGRTDDIRRWYRIESEDQADPEAVVVSVRLGDYIRLGWAISMDYYTYALDKHFKGRPVVVLSDEPWHPCLQVLDKYKPSYYRKIPIKQFAFMTTARHMVIGTSTFSWWGAFLSNANVCAPLLRRGYYFNPSNKNENYIVKEKRFVYVKNVENIK